MRPGDLVTVAELSMDNTPRSLQLWAQPGHGSADFNDKNRVGRLDTDKVGLVLARTRVDEADFLLVLCDRGRSGWTWIDLLMRTADDDDG